MGTVTPPVFGVFPDAHSVRFERTLAASAESVWSYLTVPEKLARWMAIGEVDFREGGALEIRLVWDRGEASGPTMTGLVHAAEPPLRLAYSLVDPRAPGETEVLWLSPRGSSTRLTLTQRGVADVFLARSGAAWHLLLDALEARLEGKDPAPFSSSFGELFPAYDERALAAVQKLRAKIVASRDVLVQVEKLEAAVSFYEGVLGLDVLSKSPKLVGFEAGALRLYAEKGPRFGPVLELLVPDLASAKEKLLSHGCVLEAEDGSVPRCYVRDPFGILWNLSER